MPVPLEMFDSLSFVELLQELGVELRLHRESDERLLEAAFLDYRRSADSGDSTELPGRYPRLLQSCEMRCHTSRRKIEAPLSTLHFLTPRNHA